jgi:cyclophilin family peptidyl-prolyl cis-trans isomerase
MKPNTGMSQRVGISRAGIAAAVLLLVALAPRAEAQSVRVSTDMGNFVIELQPDRAPLTVANFLRYVNEGFYTNTLFHRVVSSFVVQGGGYSADECKGAVECKPKPTHEPIVNESGNGLQNRRGTVGMARAGPPHSGNSQFYINVADNPELDPLATRWGYAVFGHITEGMDVIDKMGVVATGSMGPFKSEAPLKPIVIHKIELVKPGGGQQATPDPAADPAVMPQSGAASQPQ